MSRKIRRPLIVASTVLTFAALSPASAFAVHQPSVPGATPVAQGSTVGPVVGLHEASILFATGSRASNATVQGVINKLNAAARGGVSFGGS